MEAHYDYRDLGYGVLLTNPEGKDTLLQGDDAENLLFEIRQIYKLWENGNPNPNLFNFPIDHVDNLLEVYFF